jgi:hypothetical protein
MGKIFGILLIVVGIWVGLTIFNEGTDAAFGGIFRGAQTGVDEASGRPLPRRVEESVSKAYQAHEQRTLDGTQE